MRILLLIAALLCVVSAKAQQRLVSVNAFDLGYSGGLAFKSDDARRGDDANSNDFRLALNYAQTIPAWSENLMGKGAVRIQRIHEDQGANSTNSLWAFTGGLIYNIDAADIKNSLFFGAQGGFEWQTIDDGVTDESGLNLLVGAEVGKRWDMGNYASAMISYSPTIDFLYRRYGGGVRDEFFKSGTELRLNFLKFDIMF
jgi:hypothetical protein